MAMLGNRNVKLPDAKAVKRVVKAIFVPENAASTLAEPSFWCGKAAAGAERLLPLSQTPLAPVQTSLAWVKMLLTRAQQSLNGQRLPH